MNIELKIANRITRSQENKKTISGPIVKIAVAGIALGLAVMIMAVAIVTGFKNEIRNKVIGFGSHIQITNFDSNISYETAPISRNQLFTHQLAEIGTIRHIQTYATKAGIINTGTDIQGVVMKGIGPDFDWTFFEKSLTEGSPFSVTDTEITNQVLVSRRIASMLQLKTGDDFAIYFVQDPPRARRFTISGIYETGLEEMDKLFILTDIKHIQRLNDWSDDQVSGFEIVLHNFDNLSETKELVYEIAGTGFTEDMSRLRVVSVQDKFPQFFDWLQLLDMNVWVILTLMVVVAGFNMVSGLLILILERTTMIGVLKALGLDNTGLRKIFLYQSGFMIIKGLIWGNVLGIGIALIQKYSGLLKLDQASYFISVVPINLNILHIILLNIGTMVITFAMLILPSYIIGKISPDKTIRFD